MTNNKDTMQTKCPSCGGAMEYSPKDQKLKCVYCGATKDLDTTTETPKENDFKEWAAKTDEDLSRAGEETQELKCKQCGATVTLNGQSSAKCPFCGTPLIMDQAEVKRVWKPEYIVPFKIDKSQCAEIFSTWLNGKFFCPRKFKDGSVVADSFKGVYLPFWTFDAQTSTAYTGKRGDKTTKKDKDGNETTETEWKEVSGMVLKDFDDILVPASKSLPDSVAKEVIDYGSWDLKNVVPYKPEFAAGFTTDVYSIGFKEGFEEAKKKMEEEIEDKIESDIGGSEQRITQKSTTYDAVKFKMLLLPVFIGVFMVGDKSYTFAINGFNGECHGEYPVNKALVVGVILLVSAAVIALLYALGLF